MVKLVDSWEQYYNDYDANYKTLDKTGKNNFLKLHIRILLFLWFSMLQYFMMFQTYIEDGFQNHFLFHKLKTLHRNVAQQPY